MAYADFFFATFPLFPGQFIVARAVVVLDLFTAIPRRTPKPVKLSQTMFLTLTTLTSNTPPVMPASGSNPLKPLKPPRLPRRLLQCIYLPECKV